MLETCLEKLRYNRDGSWLDETFRSALADDSQHQREVMQDCAFLFKATVTLTASATGTTVTIATLHQPSSVTVKEKLQHYTL